MKFADFIGILLFIVIAFIVPMVQQFLKRRMEEQSSSPVPNSEKKYTKVFEDKEEKILFKQVQKPPKEYLHEKPIAYEKPSEKPFGFESEIRTRELASQVSERHLDSDVGHRGIQDLLSERYEKDLKITHKPSRIKEIFQTKEDLKRAIIASEILNNKFL